MAQHLGRRPEDPDYGLGEHSIDGDRLGLIDEEQLTAQLLKTFSSPRYRPPRLPAVAMELLALSRKPDVELDAIQSLLEQDAMLAGDVLRLAQSAFYTRARRVDGLREALVRLGLNTLRQVVMQAAMNMRVFRSTAYGNCMDRLRRHSRATAHLCRIVSRYTPIDEEQSFLCGLLHDVGIAGILLVLGDVKRGSKPPDLAVLWPAIDAAHARAGARMVELWGLPEEIAMVVGAHHQVSIDGHEHPVAATVCVAESLAAEMDKALVPSADEQEAAEDDLDLCGLVAHGRIDRSDTAVVRRATESLRLTEPQLDLIRAAAQQWADALESGEAEAGT